MPSKEHEALVEQVGQLVYKAQCHRSNPNHAASEILSTILAAQSAHIENEINGYIDYLKGLEKLPRSYVLRGMIELKRRLLAALRERE